MNVPGGTTGVTPTEARSIVTEHIDKLRRFGEGSN
jgi:hypothetical protein